MTSENSGRIGVLFVCLGNICRSPLAEGVFIHLAMQRSVRDRFDIDSCGTGAWHVGSRADPRARQTAARFGVELPSIARQFSIADDLERFAHIIAMDRSNRETLGSLGVPAARVRLMRSCDRALGPREDLDVPDPYYGGDEGFTSVYHMLTAACNGLLDELLGA